MLVVSRKENESIRIEPVEGLDPSLTLGEVFARGPILVTLTHVGTRRVRLVIEAPSELKISRSRSALAACDETDIAQPAAAPLEIGTGV